MGAFFFLLLSLFSEGDEVTTSVNIRLKAYRSGILINLCVCVCVCIYIYVPHNYWRQAQKSVCWKFTHNITYQRKTWHSQNSWYEQLKFCFWGLQLIRGLINQIKTWLDLASWLIVTTQFSLFISADQVWPQGFLYGYTKYPMKGLFQLFRSSNL